MINSMTGYAAQTQTTSYGTLSLELRAVNNRHLKIQTRVSEALAGLEPQLETLVRKNVGRGSVQLNVQLVGGQPTNSYTLQTDVVKSYWQQAQQISEELGVAEPVQLADLLVLPGSILESRTSVATSGVAPELAHAAESAVLAALESFNQMRRIEGQSMRDEMQRQLVRLGEFCDQVEERSPVVVEEYAKRLTLRLQAACDAASADTSPLDLSREITLLADKLDIREELVRIRSHFAQFENLLASSESEGRKLDFLIQEMFREANTIGSKANDAMIAQRVVDIKTTIEQMRELVQNVE